MVSVNLFSLRDSQRHAFVKRQYANLYTMSSLVSYEPSVEDCIALFSRRLSGFCREGKPVDLGRWLQFYAFDVIGAITFSKRFGFMEHGRDVGDIISTIDYTFFNTTIGGYFLWALPLLFALTPKTGTKALDEFTSAAIQERVQTTEKELGEDGPQDFMDKLFKVADKNPQENRLSLITGAAAANIGAGSDTTGITLTAILFNILQNPGVLQKLRDELDTALATGQISDPITFTESQGLPYLQAVFKESMRMHPATGLPMWRVVPPEGVVLCDRYFPGGAVVGTNTWVAHYNCDVYGKDVEDFRPERWIDNDKETLDSMNRYFMPFGLGARTCIGKNISLLEIGKLVPQLVQKFDFQLLDSSKPRLESRNVWFVKQHGFNVLVTERKGAQGK
ncbi:hypothetical protein AK830_g10426 [Neonectria ditissima]|uniref:Pisatin demethylase n=1 Tax=Neonectria ditissima TaxID=78410 RepID=A0A0P7ATH1_9HYPO|nr:hypothetical protein AK830_g10426 [Neonectria ditissima]